MSRSYSISSESVGSEEQQIQEIRSLADRDAEKLDQIQELLTGTLRRNTDARIGELEARVQALETSILRRLESLEVRISEVASRNEEQQKRTIDEVSRGISELGEKLKNSAP